LNFGFEKKEKRIKEEEELYEQTIIKQQWHYTFSVFQVLNIFILINSEGHCIM